MILKKKSLIVVIVSSFVICLVLVVNLIGYLIYLELKDDELDKAYRLGLQKVNAKVYSKNIEIDRLGASFDYTGLLSGQAVLEGIVRNDGYRDITDLCVKVKFLDSDGAVVYEVTFHPQEPSLGSYGLPQVSIPRIAEPLTSAIKPESSLPFKLILKDCPKEILAELREKAGPAMGKGRWNGKFDYEILSVNF